MGYRSSHNGDVGRHRNGEPRPDQADAPEASAPDPDKSEVTSLLRLLTQLANCGLDAAAKPLLQTTVGET